MIGVHRSANTSAPRATGQYCPYPSTASTILRRRRRRESDFELHPLPAAASIVAAMTTTRQRRLLGTGRLRPHRGSDRGQGRAVVAAAGSRAGDAGARRRCRHRERRAARRGDRRRRGGHRRHPRAAGDRGAARARARPDAALAGGRRARSSRSPTGSSTPCCRASARCSRRTSATAARELLRVCRPGGTVMMANWTPDGGGRAVLPAPEPLPAPLPATDRRPWPGATPSTSPPCCTEPTCAPSRGGCRSGSPARPTSWPPTTGGTSRRWSRLSQSWTPRGRRSWSASWWSSCRRGHSGRPAARRATS